MRFPSGFQSAAFSIAHSLRTHITCIFYTCVDLLCMVLQIKGTKTTTHLITSMPPASDPYFDYFPLMLQKSSGIRKNMQQTSGTQAACKHSFDKQKKLLQIWWKNKKYHVQTMLALPHCKQIFMFNMCVYVSLLVQ